MCKIEKIDKIKISKNAIVSIKYKRSIHQRHKERKKDSILWVN